jgi:hypothetical protein
VDYAVVDSLAFPFLHFKSLNFQIYANHISYVLSLLRLFLGMYLKGVRDELSEVLADRVGQVFLGGSVLLKK